MKSLRRGYVRPSREQRCYSDDEYREQQRLEQAAALAREAAMAFLVADVNGDGLLSRSEYKSALWRLRALFGADVTASEMTDAALDRQYPGCIGSDEVVMPSSAQMASSGHAKH